MERVATFIPSPSQGVWQLGPIPIRAYALCIIAGALAAVFIGERRYVARGGRSGLIGDVAVWAIPFGIVGARIYHVATSPELYFGAGRAAGDAFKIWQGGLGIWGGIAGGAIGALIACRRLGVPFAPVADALAPGLLVAQAIGRLGNYFNQELFGSPTSLPWGLEIDAAHRPEMYTSMATFHPTFLYELLWNLTAALILVAIDRRWSLRHGRALALYVMLYTFGRFWIEQIRIDHANYVGPFRLNVWTSMITFAVATACFIALSRRQRDDSATSSDHGQEHQSDGSDRNQPEKDVPTPHASLQDQNRTEPL